MHILSAYILTFLIAMILPVKCTAGVKGSVAFSPGLLPTTFNRIDVALLKKEISLKDSVILKAKVLYAPETLKDSVFAVRNDEVKNSDELTGFYKEVHKVFDELSPDERETMKKMSPELKVIIEQREKEKEQNGKRGERKKEQK